MINQRSAAVKAKSLALLGLLLALAALGMMAISASANDASGQVPCETRLAIAMANSETSAVAQEMAETSRLMDAIRSVFARPHLGEAEGAALLDELCSDQDQLDSGYGFTTPDGSALHEREYNAGPGGRASTNAAEGSAIQFEPVNGR